jgi:hypothetical protein|tara:strand:+ start:174 stop:431 length:258 start_codon:yes stop_codon:yes gene_type:complete
LLNKGFTRDKKMNTLKEFSKVIALPIIAITIAIPASVLVCGSLDECTNNSIERYENDTYTGHTPLMDELTKKMDSAVAIISSIKK